MMAVVSVIAIASLNRMFESRLLSRSLSGSHLPDATMNFLTSGPSKFYFRVGWHILSSTHRKRPTMPASIGEEWRDGAIS